jgi:hypothetical protein
VSYRALKLRFALDDELLAGLKDHGKRASTLVKRRS